MNTDSPLVPDSPEKCKFEDERHDVRFCFTHGGTIHEDYYAEAMREVEDDSGPLRSGQHCSMADSPEKDGLELDALDKYLGDRMGAPSKTRQFGAYRRALRRLRSELAALRESRGEDKTTMNATAVASGSAEKFDRAELIAAMDRASFTLDRMVGMMEAAMSGVRVAVRWAEDNGPADFTVRQSLYALAGYALRAAENF